MIFGRKKQEQVLADRAQPATAKTFWKIVWQQFKKNRPAVWSTRILCLIILIALFADFIANEKPIYCKIDGQSYFPIFKQYAVDLGFGKWNANFVNNEWKDQPYESSLFPFIPYSSTTIDLLNGAYVHPFAESNGAEGFRHWLGTDHLGRDIAAGMVAGARTAILVGVVSMSIATIIGIFLGAIAGYFGDQKLKLSRARILLNILGASLGLFWGFSSRVFQLQEGNIIIELGKSIGILILCLAISNLLVVGFKKLPILGKKVALAADLMVMRSIEILRAIPGLLLILAIVAAVETPSILLVMTIIGFLSWPRIARFTRAELLRVRNLEYIEAAQAMGFSERRIIFQHAIPNALTPVLITIAFGFANAILLEAFLSFLGIGLAADSVTWGSMLRLSRDYPQGWWLAIFPGLAIFITVTIFNLIGDGLAEALNPKTSNR